jgi:hypothetical protein
MSTRDYGIINARSAETDHHLCGKCDGLVRPTTSSRLKTMPLKPAADQRTKHRRRGCPR